MLIFFSKADDSYTAKAIQVNWFSVYLYSTISAEEPNIGQLVVVVVVVNLICIDQLDQQFSLYSLCR